MKLRLNTEGIKTFPKRLINRDAHAREDVMITYVKHDKVTTTQVSRRHE